MLHVGMVINGFEIQKLIGKWSDAVLIIVGQGKFSYVFKARAVADKRMVALKLIKIFDMENDK